MFVDGLVISSGVADVVSSKTGSGVSRAEDKSVNTHPLDFIIKIQYFLTTNTPDIRGTFSDTRTCRVFKRTNNRLSW